MIPLAAALAAAAAAAAPVAPAPDGARPTLAVVAVVPGTVQLDGVLDEAVWRDATFTSGFLQKEPEEGAPATQATEVAVLFDGSALYVGARMWSDGREAVATLVTRHDDLGAAESLAVWLDTFGDRRTAYAFAVTAAGVRADWYHYADDEDARDVSFDPIWEARTRVGAHGWTAELRIPLSQLRFHGSSAHRWGINFQRRVPTRNEDDFWIPVPRERTGWSSWFGDLIGFGASTSGRRLEVVPATAATARTDRGAAGPLPREDALALRGSVDARIGLGPALTLAGTVNPDFLDVEADPAVVNLTAFELELDERRPFFGESLDFLVGPGPQYFYSRRIGAVPSVAPEADHVRLPQAAPLLGALKLTGAPRPRLRVGALVAVTGEEEALVAGEEELAARGVRVAPPTGYAVTRLQRQVGSGGSVVGLSATALGRRIDAGDGAVELLPRTAYGGGADFDLRIRRDDDEYALTGYGGGSAVAGLPAAMVAIQESSAHHFQRPDRAGRGVDEDARALLGYTSSLRLARLGGAGWLWDAGGTVVSPGFELNDAGLLARADARALFGSVVYRETRPGLLHRWEAALRGDTSWTYDGAWQEASATLDLNGTWRNFWDTNVFVTARPRVLDPTLTRGGPLMAAGPSITVGAGLSDPAGVRVHWSVEAHTMRDTIGGRVVHGSGSVAVRPTDRLVLSLAPSVDVATTARQYVDTLPGGRAETFGSRYVFATVDRVDLSLELRASYFFGPTLSLDAFVQPFAARGRFRRFGELLAPRTQELLLYPEASIARPGDGDIDVEDAAGAFSFPDPDVDVRSLRSTVVLRWEWRPGSTLHAVWQQVREVERPLGPPLGAGSALESLDAPGAHTFALKLAFSVPFDRMRARAKDTPAQLGRDRQRRRPRGAPPADAAVALASR